MENMNGKSAARRARDDEFMAQYRHALNRFIGSHGPHPKRSAVAWAIHHSHPRYYVSFERAYRVVPAILKKGKTPIKPSLQASMWEEIAGHVRELMDCAPMSMATAIDYVLEHCRASRFFITEHYAYYTLVDRYRRESRERRQNRRIH